MVSKPVQVAIVEDQRDIRDGLTLLIDSTSGYCCTGAFASVEEALPAVTANVDILLMDLALPGLSGIEGIGLLKERLPALRIVVLSVYEDNDRIFDALCAGASGYLLKKTAPERLIEFLGDVMAGGAPMSPEVATRVISLFRVYRPSARAAHHLTPHEVRLLGLLADGHSYKTAAAALGSSVNTVAFHMKSIYTKLQVHSKSEAVARALRERIVH